MGCCKSPKKSNFGNGFGVTATGLWTPSPNFKQAKATGLPSLPSDDRTCALQRNPRKFPTPLEIKNPLGVATVAIPSQGVIFPGGKKSIRGQWARLARRGWCAGAVCTAPRSLEKIWREMRQAEPPARGGASRASLGLYVVFGCPLRLSPGGGPGSGGG